MKKHLKYWTLIILLSYGPTFGIHYLIRPFWFDETDDHSGLSISEMLITILFLPLYLVVFNYIAAKKYETKAFFFFNAAIIVSCIYISSRLHFLNWADSVGSRENPDFETKEVIALEQMLGLIIAVIGLTIAFFQLYTKKKNAPGMTQ